MTYTVKHGQKVVGSYKTKQEAIEKRSEYCRENGVFDFDITIATRNY